jgi:tRNA A-37 threonylcarbamoyl transferase component Bud32/ribosomal protein L40E
MLQIGQTISAYQLLARIASGGQATVYRARHTVLQREVALKVLHPHLLTAPDFVEKFAREAQLLAQLKHPNIVEVYDANRDAATGLYFIAIEFLPGTDLETLIAQQGKLAVEVVVAVAQQVASALEYAHARNLIHRDIKPSNLMLLPDGTVKVLDFGIAAIIAAGQKARTRIGTVEYMAPEHFAGNADARSDIYSLGATLYHCLTGQLPPVIAVQPPTPPRQLNPAISPALENVILKALQADPARRQQTAREFIIEMESAWRTPPVAVSAPAAMACFHCGASNRTEAKHCVKCGKSTGLRPQLPRLTAGMVVGGRYQITSEIPRRRYWYGFRWHVIAFSAKDIHTKTECCVIPMGSDATEDQWIRQLANLRHQALPKNAIIVDEGNTYFVCDVVSGSDLESAFLSNPSHLVPLGVQLCDLFESTGVKGSGFSWLDLFTTHILLNPQGQVLIDVCNYCRDHLTELRVARFFDDDRCMPPFLSLAAPASKPLTLDEGEMEEIKMVASAMAVCLGGGDPYSANIQLGKATFPLIDSLAAEILNAVTVPTALKSLAQFRQHLLALPGPARARVSSQYIDLGSVPWGEETEYSITLVSSSPGLLYGRVQSNTPHLRCNPEAFVKMHPCEIRITFSWHTYHLEACGSVEHKTLITTGSDLFQIVTHATIQPNAKFHRTQAERHLDRKEGTLALPHCNQFIALEPSNPEGYVLRGQVFKLLSDYDQAIQDFSRAITLDPKNANLYWERGLVFEAQGRKKDAINDLQKHISLKGWYVQEAQKKIADLQ